MGKIPEEYIVDKELWPDLVTPSEYEDLPEEINLAEELLDMNIKEGRGENIAILFQDRKITYQQIFEDVNRLANGLVELGLEKYDRVGIRTANIPQAVVANFAIMKIGAIPVPMSPLWSKFEITYALNNSEAKAIVVFAALLEEVEKAKPELESIEHFIVIGGDPEEMKKKGYVSYEELLKRGKPEFEAVKIKKIDPGVILYTSGTTGPPKGCIHFAGGVLVEADLVAKNVWKLKPGEVLGGSAPVSFAAGYGTFAIIPFITGATISLLPRFTPEAMLQTIQDHKISVLTGLPTAYRVLLRADFSKYDLSSLRMYTTGGEALGAETFKAWKEKTGMPIYEGLGMTEAVHLVTSNVTAPEPRPGSIGKPLPGFEIKIFDPDTGEECKPGEIGTMGVKGPTGTVYWKPYVDDNRLLKKQKEGTKDGYNIAGDMVYMDEEGYIFFVSRDDDMIKSSGYRIGPEEIEESLKKHPAIADAGVIGIPDPVRGQNTKAVLVLKEGYEPSEGLEEELKTFLRDYVAVYKLPRVFGYADEMPRTPTGKLIRRFIRDWEKEGKIRSA